MPRGPKGERRPADLIGNAVKVMRIAVGEDSDNSVEPRVVKRGSVGGLARSKALSSEARSKIAKKAAKSRWLKTLVREKIEH